jgi:hypothetical protein
MADEKKPMGLKMEREIVRKSNGKETGRWKVAPTGPVSIVEGKREQVKTIPAEMRKDLVSYKRGGRVKRSGLARLHKGERVVRRSASSRR